MRQIDPTARSRDHQQLVKKLQQKYKGKRLVLKSPPNLLFIPQILSAYPDAQFVFIQRDPFEVYHSTYKLWQATLDNYALSKISEEEIHQAILEDFVELMEAYHVFRDSALGEKLVEVDYHELKKEEESVMKKVWDFLGESPTPFLVPSTPFVPQKYETTEELARELVDKWGDFIR